MSTKTLIYNCSHKIKQKSCFPGVITASIPTQKTIKKKLDVKKITKVRHGFKSSLSGGHLDLTEQTFYLISYSTT